MANKKLTKREKFEMLAKIPAVAENEMLIEFINHELELLAKKNVSSTGEKKLTATQVANEGLKSDIYAHMAENHNRLFTIAERVTPLNTELGKEGRNVFRAGEAERCAPCVGVAQERLCADIHSVNGLRM